MNCNDDIDNENDNDDDDNYDYSDGDYSYNDGSSNCLAVTLISSCHVSQPT